MRAQITRRRAATSAVLAASLAVLAACGAKNTPPGTPEPSPEPAAGPVKAQHAPGTILISDGTNMVTIGDQPVKFPTTVKDAVWSPDGSRIAFVGGDGNVYTARPDGSSMVKLHTQVTGQRKAHPTWFGSSILYTSWNRDESKIERVNAGGNEIREQIGTTFNVFQRGADWPSGSVAQPSATAQRTDDGILGQVAYQRAGAKGPEVWVLDQNQREPFSAKIADGSEPAISPDGQKVAFVGRNGQIQVAPALDRTHQATQVTFGAATPTHLVWTPDGARIAFSTAQGAQSVAAVPVSAKANPATRLTDKAAAVDFLPGRTNHVEQVTGDPVLAAINASHRRWPDRTTYTMSEDNTPAGGVVLVSSAQPQLALAASQLTYLAHGPLLFTSGPALDPRVRDEIKRVLGKVTDAGDMIQIYIVGDDGAVPAAAEKELHDLGYATKRFTGTPTAMAVSAAQRSLSPDSVTSLMLVDSADTKTIALAAADAKMPVLLTDGGKLPAAGMAYVNQAVGAKIYAIGPARSAVPAGRITELEDSLAGSSIDFAQQYFGGPDTVVIVGDSKPAYLAIAMSLAHSTRAPMLFANAGNLAGYLDTESGTVDTAYLIGDVPADLPESVAGSIG
jgi:putative cell wall-binding protein